ncbi:MAG: hypothetical protein PVH50_08670, partial [Anaerolineae bacterium]
MFKRSVETSANPDVTVVAGMGSLQVRGESESEVRLQAREEADETSLQRDGDAVVISLGSDGTLICPRGAAVTIERILGNLNVDDLTGPLTVGTVHGNAMLVEVAAVTLDEALGNLGARGVAGDLVADEVKGNARVHGVSGCLTLGQVAGNLTTDGAQDGMDVERVRGNVRLGPVLTAGSSYRVSASGNLTLILPPEPNLRLALRAAGHVSSQIPGLRLETTDDETRAMLGGGKGVVEADVQGNVVLGSPEAAEPFAADGRLAELGAQIEWQVHEAMASLAARLESKLGGLDPELTRQRIERASEEARRKAEQAAERARMRAERAERRWQRASG